MSVFVLFNGIDVILFAPDNLLTLVMCGSCHFLFVVVRSRLSFADWIDVHVDLPNFLSHGLCFDFLPRSLIFKA